MTERELEAWLREGCARVEEFLGKALPPASEPPGRLHEGMRYAVFSPGKRVRPALAFGTAIVCGREPDLVLPLAAAVEMVHAYSLVHDDLPAMDDDDERRGRPSVHVAFGEANAILIGDALLALAFEELAASDAPAAVLAGLAHAAGSRALVGGQADDLEIAARGATLDSIASIHRRKTGALFEFTVGGAAALCDAPEDARASLARFACHYGAAFQAGDDLLDDDLGECSILLVMGPDEVRRQVESQIEAARAALAPFGEAAACLAGLAEAVVGRLP